MGQLPSIGNPTNSAIYGESLHLTLPVYSVTLYAGNDTRDTFETCLARAHNAKFMTLRLCQIWIPLWTIYHNIILSDRLQRTVSYCTGFGNNRAQSRPAL